MKRAREPSAHVERPAPSAPNGLLPEIWETQILGAHLAAEGYVVRTSIMLRRTSRWFYDRVPLPIDPAVGAAFWEAMGQEIAGFVKEDLLRPLAWDVPRRAENAGLFYIQNLKVPLRMGNPVAFWMMLGSFAPFALFLSDDDYARETLSTFVVEASSAPEDRVVYTVEYMHRFAHCKSRYFSSDADNYWTGWLIELFPILIQERRWVCFQYVVTKYGAELVSYLNLCQWYDDFREHFELCSKAAAEGDLRWALLYLPLLVKAECLQEYWRSEPALLCDLNNCISTLEYNTDRNYYESAPCVARRSASMFPTFVPWPRT